MTKINLNESIPISRLIFIAEKLDHNRYPESPRTGEYIPLKLSNIFAFREVDNEILCDGIGDGEIVRCRLNSLRLWKIGKKTVVNL